MLLLLEPARDDAPPEERLPVLGELPRLPAPPALGVPARLLALGVPARLLAPAAPPRVPAPPCWPALGLWLPCPPRVEPPYLLAVALSP
jgi:hypothetical protein